MKKNKEEVINWGVLQFTFRLFMGFVSGFALIGLGTGVTVWGVTGRVEFLYAGIGWAIVIMPGALLFWHSKKSRED